MQGQVNGINSQNNLNSNSPIVYPPIQNTAASYQMPLPQAPNIVYVKDPMSELNNCTGVTIKQQPELFEAITGCETANRYHVFGQTPQGLIYLFKCMEKSGFCMRCFCPSNVRAFNMEMNHIVNFGQPVTNLFANAQKPLMCPCFCACRPEITLLLGEQKEIVGKIVNTFTCCDPEFEIFDKNGNVKFKVHADCCQCGLLCASNVCGKFSSANFDILDGTSNKVGQITKMSAQSYSEVVTDADSYQVSFPQQASAEDKLLMIVLGLMIDYQYFESSSNDTNKRGRRRNAYYGYY
jgi:hypothetical protein